MINNPMMNGNLSPGKKAKVKRLTSAWKRKAIRQLPEGMTIEGIVSGGKGINHRQLYIGGLSSAIVFSLLFGSLLKALGIPGPLAFPVTAIILFFLINILSELGIYRSVLIVWDSSRVVILERGAFDRLISRKTYQLPLGENFSWSNDKTVIIAGQEIHLDHPELCRQLLVQALSSSTSMNQAEGAKQTYQSEILRKKDAEGLSGPRKKILIAARILIFIGFTGWIGAFICSIEDVGKLPLLAEIELPVGPAELIIDRKERIFLITKFYRRIQLYDRNGKFLHGWHLSTHKGDHAYHTDIYNRLHISVEKSDGETHYILDEKRGVIPFSEISDKNLVSVKNHREKGVGYEFRSWYIYPRVVRTHPSGTETVLVRSPFWLLPFTAPFPAFILAVIGIIVSNRINPRRSGGPQTPDKNTPNGI